MQKVDLGSGADRYLSIGANGEWYGLTYDEAVSSGNFDFGATTFTPLIRRADAASKLVHQVIACLPAEEKELAELSAAVEMVEALVFDRPGIPRAETFFLPSIRVSDVFQGVQSELNDGNSVNASQESDDFDLNEIEETPLAPRGVIVTDYDGTPTGISFTGPNCLNDSFGPFTSWVRPLDPSVEDFPIAVPDISRDDA